MFHRLIGTRCAGVWLALLLASSGWGWAQSGKTVSITLAVADQDNHPVAEATIEVTLHGQVLATAQADAAGKASLTVPGPGTYSLKISKKGYLVATTTLALAAETPSQAVDVVLTQAVLSEQKIEVTGTASNPVAETSASEANLSVPQAKDSPARPATLKDALPLIPGIVRARDGSVTIAALGENHSALLINSVNVTDPVTGEFGLSVPIDSVESISVAEMPYLAQYGQFTAGVVTAETRRGGDKWNFSLNDPLPEFRIRSGHLQGMKDASPRVNFSGPIIANRVYFLEGGEYLLNKQSVRTLPFPVNQTTSTAINSFTQFDFILSPKQTLTTTFHFAPHSLQYAGLDFFNPQPVTPDASFHDSTGTVLDRLAMGGGVLQSTVAFTRVSTAINPLGNADMVLSPTGNSGNYFTELARHATRTQWIENWTPGLLHFHGTHTLQIGSALSHSQNDGRVQVRPVLIQDAAGNVRQRIDFSGGRPIDLSDTEPAGYLQDHWQMGNHFGLDTGLRVESQTITNTLRYAPRSGFVWTPDRSARTVVRGGAGIFYDSVPLDIYRFNRFPEQTITSFDASGAVIDGPFHYINLTDQSVHSQFPFVHRAAKSGNFAPYSIAWDTEVERVISQTLILRVKYLQGKSRDMITIQPQLVQGQHALVLASDGAAETRQLEFTARVGSAERRQFFFSYVRQSARGDINDGTGYLGNFAFPVVRQGLVASLPGEIPNRFLLWGTYSLPKKIQLIPHLEYRNGFPYQPTNELQQYAPVTAGPQYRFPRYFSCDLRASKDFKINSKHAIQLSTSILNLTNHFNPLEVHANIADPGYGTFFGNNHRRVLLDFDFLY